MLGWRLDAPVAARTPASVGATVGGNDRLSITTTAAVGDTRQELQRLLFESTIVIVHGSVFFSVYGGSENWQHPPAGNRVEIHRQGHPDVHVLRQDVDHVRHQPCPRRFR